MKKFLISTVSAVAFAGVAMATPFEDVDIDGDGEVTLEELQAIDPNVTEAEFTLYDTDLSGGLDQEQYDSWRVATQGEGEAAAPMTDDPMAEEPAYEEPTEEFAEPTDEFSEEPAYDEPLDEPAYEEPGISIQEDDPWSDEEWADDEDEEKDKDEGEDREHDDEHADPYADPMK